MTGLRKRLETILSSGNGDQRRPELGEGRESSVKGLYVIGDLAGAPVIKLAMAQGVEVIETIAALPGVRDPRRSGQDLLDVLVVGAGAAGLNAALAAQEKGLRCAVLEKEKIANTIENFPEGKWIYAEPDSQPPKGKLWLDGARKEELVARWHQIVRENRLDVRTEEPLVALEKGKEGHFLARTPKGSYRARTVVIASGQRGVPRRLGVPGEGLERRLSPPLLAAGLRRRADPGRGRGQQRGGSGPHPRGKKPRRSLLPRHRVREAVPREPGEAEAGHRAGPDRGALPLPREGVRQESSSASPPWPGAPATAPTSSPPAAGLAPRRPLPRAAPRWRRRPPVRRKVHDTRTGELGAFGTTARARSPWKQFSRLGAPGGATARSIRADHAFVLIGASCPPPS